MGTRPCSSLHSLDNHSYDFCGTPTIFRPQQCAPFGLCLHNAPGHAASAAGPPATVGSRAGRGGTRAGGGTTGRTVHSGGARPRAQIGTVRTAAGMTGAGAGDGTIEQSVRHGSDRTGTNGPTRPGSRADTLLRGGMAHTGGVTATVGTTAGVLTGPQSARSERLAPRTPASGGEVLTMPRPQGLFERVAADAAGGPSGAAPAGPATCDTPRAGAAQAA